MNALKWTLVILFIILALYLFSPFGRGIFNIQGYYVHKADDRTSYRTRKEVETTARAMIASYESDKIMYNQYKDSSKENELSWASQAKIRANKTASIFNNYMLKNNYVWANNIPNDIKLSLEYIN